MSQPRSSDVNVKNSNAAFTEPLKEGIHSIKRVCEALTEADVDPFSGQCSNYNYIREQIVQAKQSLEQSEQAAATVLRSLDERIEILTCDEGKLEQKMTATQEMLDNLKMKQTSNEKLLSDSEGALELAKTNLSTTREALQRQEERRDTATTVRDVGWGVTLIPIVGWIAGPIMIAVGEAEIAQATEAIKVAEKEVKASKKEKKKYKRKVSGYESKISKTERKIKQKHKKADRIHEEIEKVNQQRDAVAEFQEKVRSAVHVLSEMGGTSRVAEVQTRRFIIQGPVMKVMEDLVKAADKITGNWLCLTDSEYEKTNAGRVRVPLLNWLFHLFSSNKRKRRTTVFSHFE
ncbi:uncharacterized protein LOC118805367 [Colossoma macropomum]|uniref:uncharacterized protein LOC118805367 n=1 Tax=Colossoma macropomum TaxID=42526 RepID=UPI001864556C|nr:uncharacterized protein LOC118805367 [Colossoma macropomum]